jgi:hypothetical protein
MADRIRIPYPLRAMRISLAFTPFSWWNLRFHKRELTEFAKAQAETQWWLNVGPFQLSYGRLL